ncbi:leucine Rich repeat-containing domain protein [Ancylostoma duodenale]|uniref:Leucine Rich repeat-containing domain protein n=1 Tax=Ancylostoma duodenale TaxID=51022 RepID=A0A0C2D0Y5_9BILA|nr:leucine Rich repeat-containing domain protein [Ancylostoma duodenale]
MPRGPPAIWPYASDESREMSEISRGEQALSGPTSIGRQVLNVSSNWISTLTTADSSCIANQLIIVDFSHNRLDRLGTELNTLPAVRQLSLSNNRLSSIDKDSLLKCPLLQQLELNNNLLEAVEDLPVTSVLEFLDLSWNHISALPSRLYPNSMGSLVHLHLEGNQISELKPLQLVNYTRLQTVSFALVPYLSFAYSLRIEVFDTSLRPTSLAKSAAFVAAVSIATIA